MAKIFICTSFSTKVDATGAVLPDYKDLIEPVIMTIRQAGHNCFAAIEAEGWKITDKDPTEEFKKDLTVIYDSDIMLALLEESVSAGVQIEIGYMLAQIDKHPRKQLVLAHQKGTLLSWSNAAIGKLPGVSTVEYTDAADITSHIAALLAETAER